MCPAGKALYRKGQPVKKGLLADQYQGSKRDCVPCAQRAQCLRTPAQTLVRQVAFFHGRDPAAPPSHTARMQARIDSPEGRAQYAERFGAVEPVFGNLRYKGARPLYVARPREGGRAVEALLPGPEHREARTLRVRGLTKNERARFGANRLRARSSGLLHTISAQTAR